MDPDKVFELNKQLTASENHFNSQSLEYRKLASFWLLATFSGLGFVLTHPAALPFSLMVSLSLVCYAGITGLIVLWNIDTAVYHRLLDANFIEGLKLEEEYPYLPQVRHNMMKLHGGRGVQPRIWWFYGTPVFLLAFIAAFCLTNYYMPTTIWIKLAIWGSHLFAYGIITSFIKRETAVTSSFRKRTGR